MKKKKHLLRIIITLIVFTIVIMAVKGLVPKSKASLPITLDVSYKSGDGTGKSITTTQKILDEQTQGDNDYTNRKIVLYKNGDTTSDNKAIKFEGGTVEENGHTYEKILTGWKVTSVTYDGKKITEYVRPENNDYSNTTNAVKDINTIYAQNGWYVVPDGVTAIEVTAIYGKAIYVRSPYDKMYYDEYHIFEKGTNASTEQEEEKSSDDNFGTSENDAVATLKRAYELINEDASKDVYDTIFVLCGDLYEVNYNKAGQEYVSDNKGTYKNYSSENLGYNKSNYKPVTITSNSNVKYNLYLAAPTKELNSYSSLRFDNINLKSLPNANVNAIHGTEVNSSTYSHIIDLGFYSNGRFEVTETVSTENKTINLFYRNLSKVKLNAGKWNPMVAKNEDEITNLSSGSLIQVAGITEIDKLTIGYENIIKESNAIIENPSTVNITGGIIEKISGTSNANIKGNLNIFISGGKITTLHGIEDKKIIASKDEEGNVNVKVYGGNIGVALGKEGSGTASGNINLVIDNFGTKIDNARYKKIGQIDNWKNVIIKNSHVILESKNENGKTDEITNIENLSVLEGSGLKLSTNSKILGNFTGGGELYLDSDICLKVEGDILGTTKLVLNPVFIDGNNVIKGGIDHPYIKVGGSSKTKSKISETISTLSTDEKSNIEIKSEEVISGESNYTIMASQGDYSYYYLSDSVEISNFAEVKSTSVKDKVYSKELSSKEGSLADNISILEIDSFTNEIKINYEFYKDTTKPNKYANITREFVLKDNEGNVYTIPKGTELLMINAGTKYTYVADNNTDGIDLSLFKNDNGENYISVKNLQKVTGVTEQQNEVTGNTLYKYSEEYRFIVSFANIIENNGKIEAGTYYPIINIKDSGTLIGDEQKENTNKINIAQVVFTPNNLKTEREKYEANETININANGTVKTYGGEGKALYGAVKLYDSKNKRIYIPNGAKIKVNNIEYELINGSVDAKFLDNCTDTGTSYNLSFQLDMTNVLEQNELSEGQYKLVFEYRFSEDNLIAGNIAGWSEATLVITDTDGKYGLNVEIENDSNIPEDKLQLITKGKNETRNITVKCKGTNELEEPYVTIITLEKTGKFDYTSTSNSKKIICTGETSFATTDTEKSNVITVKFAEDIKEGTYRIKFELYDKYGNKKTENYANFVVVDTPEK